MNFTALGNFLGALDGVAQVGEQGQHFRFAFDIHLVGAHAHAVFIVQGFSCLDANQHLLGGGVFLVQVVGVVGGNQGHAGFFRQFYQPGDDHLLLTQAMVHHFDEEVVFAHDVLHGADIVPGVVIPSVQQQLAEVARQAGAQRNQPFAVLAQQVVVDARAVVETAYPRFADQFH